MARLIVEATTNEILGRMDSVGFLEIFVSVSDEDGKGVTGLTKDHFRISQSNLEIFNPDWGGLVIDVTERKWEDGSSLSGFYDLSIHKQYTPSSTTFGPPSMPTNINLNFGIEVFDSFITTTNPPVRPSSVSRHGRTLITINNI